MKKIITLYLVFWIFFGGSSDAQQLLSTNGGNYESEQIHVSWSAGEPVIQTISGNWVLTQGFQQPSGNIFYQLLNIPAGWSGVSTYLNLTNTDLDVIFQPHQNDLIIFSSMSGFYYPSQSVNTLGGWDYLSGYQMKAENDFTLNLAGHSFADAMLDVDQGWNLIPVLSRCAVPVEELFQNQESVIIAKEVAGTNLYWPAYGINTLGAFLPGKSYYVAFESPETLNFPQCTKASSGSVNPASKPVNHPWNEITRNAGSHSIAIPAATMAGSGISAGDIIGVFTAEGICAGVEQVINPGKSPAITAYGNDEISTEKNGFFPGEILRFKVYKPELNQDFDLEVEYDLTLPQTGSFVANGLSAIGNLKLNMASTGLISKRTLSVYPNPSTGKVYLGMNRWPEDLTVTITNVQQSIIAQFKPETSDLQGPILIDLGSKPNGVYFFTVAGADYFSVHKVILH